jgi:hypothetical protein
VGAAPYCPASDLTATSSSARKLGGRLPICRKCTQTACGSSEARQSRCPCFLNLRCIGAAHRWPPQDDASHRSRSCVMPDAADMTQLARLSRLTHLDLGSSSGVLALAPLLPDLQSLVLPLMSTHDPASGSAIT